MPLPIAARDYLFQALEATPVVVAQLARGVAADDPRWDRRPDPERFTLREALAHLADWEPIWLERVSRIAEAGNPFLPSVDESALAIENSYSEQPPSRSIDRFLSGRRELVAFLRTVPDEAWDLTGDREFVGVLTLQQQAYFALSHDGYHMRQIVEWIKE
jgi:hypothetical protein